MDEHLPTRQGFSESAQRPMWDHTLDVAVSIDCQIHGEVAEYDVLIDGTIVCGYCATDEEVNRALRPE